MTSTSVKLSTSNTTSDSIAFGVTNNNYGYIIPGADTVTPFRHKTKTMYYAVTNGIESAPTLSYSFVENTTYQISFVTISNNISSWYGSLYGTSITLSNAIILDSYYNTCETKSNDITYYYFVAKSNCNVIWKCNEHQTNGTIYKTLVIEQY